MRVLFVTHNIPRHDGDVAGSFVLRLAVALQSIGHHVDVIAPGAPGLAPYGVIDGVAIDRIRYGSDSSMTLAYTGTMAEQVTSSWRGKFALFAMLRSIRRAVQAKVNDAATKGTPYDIVHAHWWFPSALALVGAESRRSPPLVITMHGSDVRLAHRKPVAHPLMRAALKQASARSAVSRWLADIVDNIAPPTQTHVAPMPVDTVRFAPPDTVVNQRAGILFVGRLNAQKGLSDVLDAMSLPALSSAQLTVVGDGPDAAALRTKAATLGVSSRAHWVGPVAQPSLAALFQRAVCVAMPSREEGLGLTAVEAQLCETPVVAYASGGVVDVVQPSRGGTLVPVGDIREFAHSLAALVSHPDVASEKGRHSRTEMLKRFSPNVVAAQYTSIYEEAIRVRR